MGVQQWLPTILPEHAQRQWVRHFGPKKVLFGAFLWCVKRLLRGENVREIALQFVLECWSQNLESYRNTVNHTKEVEDTPKMLPNNWLVAFVWNVMNAWEFKILIEFLQMKPASISSEIFVKQWCVSTIHTQAFFERQTTDWRENETLFLKMRAKCVHKTR